MNVVTKTCVCYMVGVSLISCLLNISFANKSVFYRVMTVVFLNCGNNRLLVLVCTIR